MDRMIKLLENASSQGAQVVLFPEVAFTTVWDGNDRHGHINVRYSKTDDYSSFPVISSETQRNWSRGLSVGTSVQLPTPSRSSTKHTN